MSRFPKSLESKKNTKSICLILEGYEEEHYFKRLIDLNVFNPSYKITTVNAKSASNIPARYQDALSKNYYASILIVCDMDRKPDAYNGVVNGIKKILGNENAESIIFFSRPCTLQIILSHFGEVSLQSQSKFMSRDDVKRLTGVDGYDAHKEQIKEICQQIYRSSWKEFHDRLTKMNTDPNEMPSSNLIILFDRLLSENTEWIDALNELIFK